MKGMVRIRVRVRVTTACHLHRAVRAVFVFADMIQYKGKRVTVQQRR
jgi:hypothetical protein